MLFSWVSSSSDAYHYSTVTIQSLPGLAIQSSSETQAHVEMLKCIKEYNPDSSLSFGYILENIQKRSLGPIISPEEVSIWKLGSALFDSADVSLFLDTDNEEKQQIVESSVRKEVVSRWLKEACRDALAEDLSLTASSFMKIFIYLTGRLCAKAVDECLKSRLYKLALLVAQQGGAGAAIALNHGASGHLVPGRGGMDETTRDLIDEQIKLWEQEEWTAMDKDLLRLWKVCSGNPEHWDETVLGQLDWKRAFGMFLWYYKGGWCSLADAVEAYQEAFQKSSYIAQPLLGSDVDCHFEMLKLFSQSDYPLQKVLHPAKRGKGPLDLRVTWMLRLMLSHCYSIDPFVEGVDSDVWAVKISDDITVGYALQLESEGLWLWGCYVLSYLQDQPACAQATREMIGRNYPLNDTTHSIIAEFPDRSPTSSTEWEFLVNDLNVPPQWIFEAKALKARYKGCVEEEAAALFDAGHLTSAYHLIMARVAPKAVAQDDFIVIRLLLNRLTETQHWSLGGGLLLDYFNVYSEAKTIMDDAVTLSQDQKEDLIQRLSHLLKRLEGLFKEDSISVLSTHFVEREFGKRAADDVSDMLYDIANRLVNLIHDIEESIVLEVTSCLNLCLDFSLITCESRLEIGRNAWKSKSVVQ
jgi:nuclear pore complex protein Nup98-Nup96